MCSKIFPRGVPFLGGVALGFPVSALLVLLTLGSARSAQAEPEARERESERVWMEEIRPQVFAERTILEGAGQDIVEIKVPFRAEDAAIVPISIHSKIPQAEERYIKSMYVFADRNPVPLVGQFELSPMNGRADLAMRVRIDFFTYIRVIAELNDGTLHMDKSYIRSAGGCSAPPGKSLTEALALLGNTRVKQRGVWQLEEPGLVQLQISHPNVTGMSIDPRTNRKPIPYFLNRVEVSYDDAPVLSGTLTFSISEDPSFRFFMVPQRSGGLLKVKATDTKNKEFSFSQELGLQE